MLRLGLSRVVMINDELVSGSRRGDRAAQLEIYALTSSRILRLLTRISGNYQDALDLTQDTYVRAFTRISQFDGRASFETWLSRIAVNMAIQHVRRRGLERKKMQSLRRLETTTSDHDHHNQEVLEQALGGLTIQDRALLILRYQEGYDYRTIAELTGCSLGTVGSRLNRARRHVRELLKSKEEKSNAKHPISKVEIGIGASRSDGALSQPVLRPER